jgi:hypothetical protein
MALSPKTIDHADKQARVTQAPNQTVRFALVLDQVQHEILPFAVALVGLVLLAV